MPSKADFMFILLSDSTRGNHLSSSILCLDSQAYLETITSSAAIAGLIDNGSQLVKHQLLQAIGGP